MPRVYQSAHLADGSRNPRYNPRKRSGKHLSKFARGKFVAWDGEGITNDSDEHKYVMLLNSERQHLVNLAGLPTVDCLQLLCDEGEKHRNAIHVVFGGSYDVNMILTDCTKDEIARIWKGEWVTLFNRFAVNYRPRKSFSVRPAGFRQEKGKLRKRYGRGLVLWDVFGFFQSSFVDALTKYLGKDYAHLALITQRKKERHTFSADALDGIIDYCALECTALVTLMERLRSYLSDAGLSITRWDGAGACAAALLKREGTLAHKSKHAETPPTVLLAAQHAYAGGRTELLRYGHAPVTPVFHYDINSAYPAAMRECPSLSHGRWTRFRQRSTGGNQRPDFGLYYIEWNFVDGPTAFPFFWRAYDAAIYYPRTGRGWYWGPELAAAYDAVARGVIRGRIKILDGWQWQPAEVDEASEFPFRWIDALFEQRKQWKAQGIGAEKVVKLAINSLYGKTAQHLGGTDTEPPRYHQLEWAGYITSRTRATLYRALCDAIVQDKNAGVMLATDAIYSLVPLALPLGDSLGQWSAEPHDGITVVQSGVYWTYNNGEAKAFCRGFDKGSLDADSIVRAWRDNHHTFAATLTRFVTMGSALPARDFKRHWQRWKTAPRSLALTPKGTKRASVADWRPGHTPADGLLCTQPAIPHAQIVGQLDSAPYPLPWSLHATFRDTMFDGAPLSLIEQEAYDATI